MVRSAHLLHSRTSGSLPPRGQNAYTLLEILLAVTVLLIVGAVAASPMINAYRDNRLAGAAEDVRSLLAGTRIQSLDRDETWQFRYEPGGAMFVRLPTTTTDGEQTDAFGSGRLSGTLPEGVTFSADSTSLDALGTATRADLAPDMFAGLPDAGELTQASWSDPIYFYPDGTADSVEFEITDQYGSVRRVNVRDLTGGVTVSRQSSL